MGMQLKTWMKRNRIAIRRILSLALAIAMVPGFLVLTDNILSVGASGGGAGDEVTVEDNPRDLPGEGEEEFIAIQNFSEGVGFDTFGIGDSWVNQEITTAEQFQEIVDSLGFSATMRPEDRELESGRGTNLHFSLTFSSVNNCKIADNSLSIRVTLPEPAKLTGLQGQSDKVRVRYGTATAPYEDNTPSKFVWITFAKDSTIASSGSTLDTTLSNLIPFPNGITDDGFSHEYEAHIFFKDKDSDGDPTLINFDVNKERIAAITDKFGWTASTATVTNAKWANNGVLSDLVTQTDFGDTVFTYTLTNAMAASGNYGKAYTRKVEFVEYFSIPDYIDITDANLSQMVSVSNKDQNNNNITLTATRSIVGYRAADTTKASKIKVVVEAVNPNPTAAEFPYSSITTAVTFKTEAFNDVKFRTDVLVNSTVASFTLASTDGDGRGVKAYTQCKVDTAATTNQAKTIVGTDQYQEIVVNKLSLSWSGKVGADSAPQVTANTIRKTVATTSDGTYSQSVTGTPGSSVYFKLSGFENQNRNPLKGLTVSDMHSNTLMTKSDDQTTRACNINQIYPTSIYTGTYQIKNDAGAYVAATALNSGTYTVAILPETTDTWVIKTVPYNTAQTIDLSEYGKVRGYEFRFGDVPHGFRPAGGTDAPVIAYTVRDPSSIYTYYNAVTMTFKYGEGTEEVTYKNNNYSQTYSQVNITKANYVSQIAKKGFFFDSATGTPGNEIVSGGVMPKAGDYVYYEVTIENKYSFPVNKIRLVDTYSSNMTSVHTNFNTWFTATTPAATVNDANKINNNKITLTNPMATPANSFQALLDSSIVMQPGDKIKFTYVLQVNNAITEGATLTNKYIVYGYQQTNGTGPNPGPGTGTELIIGEGEWTGTVGSGKGTPTVAVTKTVTALDGGDIVRLTPGSKVKYTITIKMTAESKKRYENDPLVPVTVNGLIDSAQKGLTLDPSTAKIISAVSGKQAVALTTDKKASPIRSNAIQDHYAFDFGSAYELINTNDTIVFTVEATVDDTIFTGANAGASSVTLKNQARFFTKEEPIVASSFDNETNVARKDGNGNTIGDYGIGNGIGYILDSSSGNYKFAKETEDYYTSSEITGTNAAAIMAHTSITVLNQGSDVKGYMKKEFYSTNGGKQEISVDTGSDSMREYTVKFYNTGANAFDLDGIMDVLPPFEVPQSVSIKNEASGTAAINLQLSMAEKITDAVNSDYWYYKFGVLDFTTAFTKGSGEYVDQLGSTANSVTLPVRPTSNELCYTITVTTKLDRSAALTYLKNLPAPEKTHTNTVYAYFNKNVSDDRAVVENNDGSFLADHAKRHVSTADVKNKRSTIVPTVFIQPYVKSGSSWVALDASKPVNNGETIRWRVTFANPVPAGIKEQTPAYMVILPEQFNFDVNGGFGDGVYTVNTDTKATVNMKITTLEDKRTVIIFEPGTDLNIATNLSNLTNTVRYDIQTRHPSNVYTNFTAYAYNIPLKTQQDFDASAVSGLWTHPSAVSEYKASSTQQDRNLNTEYGLTGANALPAKYADTDGKSTFTSHSATVSIYGVYGGVASKEIKDTTNPSNKVNGNTGGGDNFITVDNQTVPFTYTLEVANKSEKQRDFTKLVIIDTLPQVGDTGVTTKEERGSEVGARMVDPASGSFNAWVLRENKSTQPLTYSNNASGANTFTVQYALNLDPAATFSDSDWGYDGSSNPVALNTSRWVSGDQSDRNAVTAIRIQISEDVVLNKGDALYVTFNALLQIDNEKQLNKIAYNSFGYHYSAQNVATSNPNIRVSHKPSPAKVGVKTDALKGKETIEIEKTLVSDIAGKDISKAPDTTFTFNVFAIKPGTTTEIPLRTVANGNPVTVSMTYDTVSNAWSGSSGKIRSPYIGYDYVVYETAANLTDGAYSNDLTQKLKLERTDTDTEDTDIRHFVFSAINKLKSKSIGIIKEVENAASTAFQGEGENVFTFQLNAYKDATLTEPVDSFTHDPVKVEVKWNGSKWVSDKVVINDLPVQYHYGFVEVQSGPVTFKDTITGPKTGNDGIPTFTAVNNAPDIYFSLEKVLIEDGLDNVVENKFHFNVTPTGKDTFPVEINVTKVNGTNTYTGSYEGATAYPYGTEFDVKEDTSRLNKTYEEKVTGDLELINDRWVYAFTYENKAPGTEYVKARIDKSVVGDKDAFDRAFYFKVTPSRFGTDLEPEYLTVTVGDNRTGSVETKLAYIKGTTFTVEEIRMDELTYDYRTPAISEGILSEDGYTYVFTAVNTLEDGEVYARIRKTIEDSDTNVNGVFTFSVTPIDKDGQPLPSVMVTIRMNGGRVAVSDPIGPYPYGTRFPTSGIVETSTGSVRYYSPLINITSDGLDANGDAWFTINANNQRIPPETPDTPNDPNPTPPDVTPTTPATPTTPSGPSGPNRNSNPDYTPIGDQPIPLANLPGLTTIMDDDVPLSNLPFTGGGKAVKRVGFFGFLALMAGALAGAFGKKKEDEDEPA